MVPWLLILVVIVMSLFTACSTTTSQTTQATQATQSTKTTQVTTSTAASTSTTAQGKWWDKFGTPQYGGKITYSCAGLRGANFDTYSLVAEENDIWFEAMFEPDWTVSPDVWFMSANFAPDKYYSGNLAESWEITDATTITVKVRQGIKWQNIAPLNGREFTAEDVAAHYNRVLGWDGKTEPSPIYSGSTTNWASVTATDKYIVVYKFKAASAQNFQSIADRMALNQIEAPEFAAMSEVERQDWHNAVGTGPWMLEEYIDGSSFNYAKNPNYWGHDPRYPENQTPYADELTMVVIEDTSTRTAALRTGKIDTLGSGGNTTVAWKQADTLRASNAELEYKQVPGGAASVILRVDKAPFTDARVRQALNMSIDREAIAKSIYGGNATGVAVGLITATMNGYAYAYADWPQSLKDKYSYNPTEAKALLAEAGYPDGFKTNVVDSGANTEILEIYKAYFLDIGVDLDIRTMDSVTLEAFTRAGKHDQMATGGAAQNFPPTRIVDLLYSKGGSDAIMWGLADPNGDAGYDALRDKFWAASDSSEAMNLMQQIDKYYIEQQWQVAACESYAYVLWQPWLKGYSGEGTQWSQGVLWSRLWIDSSLKK